VVAEFGLIADFDAISWFWLVLNRGEFIHSYKVFLRGMSEGKLSSYHATKDHTGCD